MGMNKKDWNTSAEQLYATLREKRREIFSLIEDGPVTSTLFLEGELDALSYAIDKVLEILPIYEEGADE